MKTIEEIAQWVIDNRYPKSENDKVSDFEMYQTLIEAMNQVLRQPPVSGQVSCNTCKFFPPQYDDYCSGCIKFARHELQETLR
jgi:hypothetical protein